MKAKKSWIKIRFEKDPHVSERLDRMTELGEIPSMEETDFALFVLGDWNNRKALRKTLREAFPDTAWTEEVLEDRDWNRGWIEGFQPIRVHGTLWVTPPWHLDEIPEGHETVIINPGAAFGTGTHESTRLALQAMTGLLKKGDRVLDLGCGSGILSIAARKMGAGRVHAIDNDPEIGDNLSENLRLNAAADISWEIRDILAMRDFSCDLALINIQKHIILPLLERFNIAKGTPERVILAGLLFEHRGDVETALESSSYKVLDVLRMNDWIAVSAIRRSSNEK